MRDAMTDMITREERLCFSDFTDRAFIFLYFLANLFVFCSILISIVT